MTHKRPPKPTLSQTVSDPWASRVYEAVKETFGGRMSASLVELTPKMFWLLQA